jgi:hypothetical protein
MHVAARNLLSFRKTTASEATKAEIIPAPKTGLTKSTTSVTPKSGQKEPRRPDSSSKVESDDIAPECLAIGTPVEMLFGDGVWYKGTIQRFSARSGVYTIVFPDGDVQTAKLPDSDVRVLEHAPPPGQEPALTSPLTNGHRRSSAGSKSGGSTTKGHCHNPSLFLFPLPPVLSSPSERPYEHGGFFTARRFHRCGFEYSVGHLVSTFN